MALQSTLLNLHLLEAVETSESISREQALQTLASLDHLKQTGLYAASGLAVLRRGLGTKARKPQAEIIGHLRSHSGPVEQRLRDTLDQRSLSEADRIRRWKKLTGDTPDSIDPFGLVPLPSPSYEIVPSWARELSLMDREGNRQALALKEHGTVLLGGQALIVFREGRHWIRDLGGPMEVSLNDRSIQGQAWQLLGEGEKDSVLVGKEVFHLSVPTPHPLEKLSAAIAGARDLDQLMALLSTPETQTWSDRIRRHLEHYEDLGEIPDAGGLKAKVWQLLLDEEVRDLKDQYMPDLDRALAESLMDQLADGVAHAASPQGLLTVIGSSMLTGASNLARGIQKFFGSKGQYRLDHIPVAFGLRARVVTLARSEGIPEERLGDDASRSTDQARIAVLEAQVAGLERELSAARAGAPEALNGRLVNLPRVADTDPWLAEVLSWGTSPGTKIQGTRLTAHLNIKKYGDKKETPSVQIIRGGSTSALPIRQGASDVAFESGDLLEVSKGKETRRYRILFQRESFFVKVSLTRES